MQLGFSHLHDVRERERSSEFWTWVFAEEWMSFHGKRCQLRCGAEKLPLSSSQLLVRAAVVLSSSCTHLEYHSLVAFTPVQINPKIYPALSSTIRTKHQLHADCTQTLRNNQKKEQYFHTKVPELGSRFLLHVTQLAYNEYIMTL